MHALLKYHNNHVNYILFYLQKKYKMGEAIDKFQR